MPKTYVAESTRWDLECHRHQLGVLGACPTNDKQHFLGAFGSRFSDTHAFLNLDLKLVNIKRRKRVICSTTWSNYLAILVALLNSILPRNRKSISMSLNDVWEGAVKNPYQSAVPKERQFLVAFSLLLIGRRSLV